MLGVWPIKEDYVKVVDIFSGEVRESAFATAYTPCVADFSEHPSPDSEVDRAYIPPDSLIRDMLASGELLLAARKARYDTEELELEEGADVPLDITREPGVDMVDVQRAAERLSVSLAEQKAGAEAAHAAAAKAAHDAEVRAAAAELLRKEGADAEPKA